jgi:nitrate reductase alpha subunit
MQTLLARYVQQQHSLPSNPQKSKQVHIVTDAVSSQRLADREVALTRLVQSGAFMATSEMALFQLATDASAPYFKEISALAREPRMDLPHHPASRI